MNPVIVISDKDNVATALEALEPGRVVTAVGLSVTVHESIPRGHKLAVCAIPAGAEVTKYGSPIGVAIADIAVGTHVHTHNVSSSRGRGDLGRKEDTSAEGHIAEPPDSKGNP